MTNTSAPARAEFEALLDRYDAAIRARLLAEARSNPSGVISALCAESDLETLIGEFVLQHRAVIAAALDNEASAATSDGEG